MAKGGIMTPVTNVVIISFSTLKKLVLEKKKAMLITYGNISDSPVVCKMLVWYGESEEGVWKDIISSSYKWWNPTCRLVILHLLPALVDSLQLPKETVM